MNPRTVSRITGLLLLMVSFAMAGCAAFAWLDPMPSPPGAALALIQAAGVTCIFSFLLVASGGLNFKIERILRRDAVLVVGLGWILSSGFGALPFVLAEPGLNFAGGFFEAASGFTTTGSSVIVEMEAWPRGILLWRAVTQWLGGIGILVLFVAMLSYLGVSSKSLFQNESTFRGGGSGVARIQDTAKFLLFIYLGVSAICCLGLKAMGLTWFNAICYAMASVSTGGLSPQTVSLAYYSAWGNSWLIELWIIFFMFLCSLNFLLFVVIINKNWRRLKAESDAVWLCGICGFSILAISIGRWWTGDAAFIQSLRDAAFSVVTISSTTGFGTADYQEWPAWCQVILGILMLIGGCAGSTSGGLKVTRLIVFLHSARQEIIRTFRPNQVFRLTLNGNPVSEEARARTLFFVALYMMIIAAATAVVAFLEAGTGVSLETCIGAVLATLSNIGPGFGSVGPSENFAHLRPGTHILLAWLMILGRLELYALLVLLLPSAWRKY